ncbi:MAG TPA: OB-fold nucleic acid binding domain-containing protein, partial [Planctomycetota bacterium]|nr:OB-fold nucleic acid binding domain-containing protein [Planctomycetota bacterium]
MEATRIEALGQKVGERVRVSGWLYNRRSKGKIHFLQVRDGSGIVQSILVKGEVPEDVFDAADHLPYESAISVEGSVRADARAPGGVEL